MWFFPATYLSSALSYFDIVVGIPRIPLVLSGVSVYFILGESTLKCCCESDPVTSLLTIPLASHWTQNKIQRHRQCGVQGTP